MIGLGDVSFRDMQTIRLLQAVTGAVQVFLGYAGVGDIIPENVTIFIMASVGAIQAGLAIWNAGLYNNPIKQYEPPKP